MWSLRIRHAKNNVVSCLVYGILEDESIENDAASVVGRDAQEVERLLVGRQRHVDGLAAVALGVKVKAFGRGPGPSTSRDV